MMIRVIYLCSVLAIIAAGGVLILCVAGRWESAEAPTLIVSRGPIFENAAGIDDPLDSRKRQISPLVAVAQAFSLHLNPPTVDERPTLHVFAGPPVQTMSAVRIAAPALRFKLHGTSCCPNQPSRSMALISEVGAAEGMERWVKEGSQVGHVVIHEIRQDGIVYRGGDQLREIAVEAVAGPTSIVQDVRRGFGRSIAAARDATVPLPSPVEPNGAAAGEN